MSSVELVLLGGLLGLLGMIVGHLVAERIPGWRIRRWQARKDAEWAQANRKFAVEWADSELERLSKFWSAP